MSQELHGILHSRGGFITRSKRSGPTKVGKRRTAVNYKKRGHKKTQKRRFFGMGLFGGGPKKRERSASASSNSSAKERHDRKRRAVSGAYNAIYGNPQEIEHSLTPPSRSPSPLTPPSPIRVHRDNYSVFFYKYCKKHHIVTEDQFDVQNNLEKIKKAYDKYVIDGILP